eukprot:Em0006g880a
MALMRVTVPSYKAVCILQLGTHKSLRRNENAKATVAAIIDGTGSLGAAVGPLIAGAVSEYSWDYTFYILMASCFIAALLLSRLAISEVVSQLRKFKPFAKCLKKLRCNLPRLHTNCGRK